MAASAKLVGTVKKILHTQGFGFITAEKTGEDYFFHRSAVDRAGKPFQDFQENDAVTFLPGEGASGKGPRATEVQEIK